MMDEDERKTFGELPDELTIYRGYAGKRKNGLSWTLSLEKAEWFADRFEMMTGETSYVVKGTCKKADVIAYFDRRQEDEILIDPAKVVGIVNALKNARVEGKATAKVKAQKKAKRKEKVKQRRRSK
jgi:hypothetical protein